MKRLIFILILVSIGFSCQKDEFDIVNLNGNKISIIGHGGMGNTHVYPINSFESISTCLNIEADGVEIDVQMTSDSVLVAFHSSSLDNSTELSGSINERSWSEISNINYNIPPYSNYRIVSLDQIFTKWSDKGEFAFFLDCNKFAPLPSSPDINTFLNALMTLIDKHNISDKVYIELTRRDIIQNLRNKRPDIRIFANYDFNSALELAEDFQLEGITVDLGNISVEQVSRAHSKNIMVAVFGASSKKKNRQAIEKNVDFIQTDKVKHLIRLLK